MKTEEYLLDLVIAGNGLKKFTEVKKVRNQVQTVLLKILIVTGRREGEW